MQVIHSVYITMYPVLLILCLSSALANDQIKSTNLNNTLHVSTTPTPHGCVCGIFLTKQFKKGSKEPPIGDPAVMHEHPGIFSCTQSGNRHCVNKCLETIVKFLPSSSTILCGSIEHSCYKEKAYLFIQNCQSGWINTNLSTGKEYCCKDGAPYKCPLY
ncbi:follicle cell protein 3C-1-like [Osmia lignaria lignaria]|uniref:follicle cell protein 3C-1-like n=1 Tax=Osmia lignaria lignaria TaxID=1437193 RepID=UPI00402BCB2F